MGGVAGERTPVERGRAAALNAQNSMREGRQAREAPTERTRRRMAGEWRSCGKVARCCRECCNAKQIAPFETTESGRELSQAEDTM